MLIRCHALGAIMTDAQSVCPSLMTDEAKAIKDKKKRTDEEAAIWQDLKDQSLSAGAKTYLDGLAGEIVYGYRKEISGKPIQKGLICEDDSIHLYNAVFFDNLTKNAERRDNGLITGECDLVVPGKKGIDIKTSWSLDTFPKMVSECHDSTYEWQARGYMMLWDVPKWEIAYCMVTTPDELIGYEQANIHYVDHIEPHMRVTVITYERDAALEAKIIKKVRMAQDYIKSAIELIKSAHGVAA